MAKRNSTPDTSGLLISRPIVRGGFSARKVHKAWVKRQDALYAAETERAREVKAGRDKARAARKALGPMPDPRKPYKAFGGARVTVNG